jgi:hypothetical protein
VAGLDIPPFIRCRGLLSFYWCAVRAPKECISFIQCTVIDGSSASKDLPRMIGPTTSRLALLASRKRPTELHFWHKKCFILLRIDFGEGDFGLGCWGFPRRLF